MNFLWYTYLVGCVAALVMYINEWQYSNKNTQFDIIHAIFFSLGSWVAAATLLCDDDKKS